MGPEKRHALVHFPPPGDSWLAVGTPQFGLQGFRTTHRQAGEAHVVARRLNQRVTLYEDVMLEAFALREESVAREMTQSVMADLDASDSRSGELRETLRAYFAASQNAASAAAALKVHEQTVARRIQTIEQRLGYTVNSRRAELEFALRLEPLLGEDSS